MQLAPGEKFAIVRQLPDPNDSATYYVQAVVRDAHTDALLESVSLTDRGSRRFSALWNVYSKKNDGFYISITTTVYTDAGYTTKSDIYSEESETYLIERRDYHSGGSSGIGANKVREIVTQVVAEALAAHAKAIDERLAGLGGEPADPVENYDDSEVLTAITELTTAVKAIEVKPEVKVTIQPTNLAPILSAVEQNGERVAKAVKDGVEGISGALGKATADHGTAIESLAKLVAQGNLPDFVKEFVKKLVPQGSLAEFVGLIKQLEGGSERDNKPVPTYQEIIQSFRKKT